MSGLGHWLTGDIGGNHNFLCVVFDCYGYSLYGFDGFTVDFDAAIFFHSTVDETPKFCITIWYVKLCSLS